MIQYDLSSKHIEKNFTMRWLDNLLPITFSFTVITLFVISWHSLDFIEFSWASFMSFLSLAIILIIPVSLACLLLTFCFFPITFLLDFILIKVQKNNNCYSSDEEADFQFSLEMFIGISVVLAIIGYFIFVI